MARINLASIAFAASLALTGASAMAWGNGGWNGGWNQGHNDHGHNDHGHDDHGHGSSDQWYSDYHHRWFYKSGGCDQYDGYGWDTCNTGKDYMQCDYDKHTNDCYPAGSHH